MYVVLAHRCTVYTHSLYSSIAHVDYSIEHYCKQLGVLDNPYKVLLPNSFT